MKKMTKKKRKNLNMQRRRRKKKAEEEEVKTRNLMGLTWVCSRLAIAVLRDPVEMGPLA